MKKISLLSALTVSTILSACGGGGGGGHGNIPNTTLPDITSSNAEVTSMSNERFSNINKAREIVEDANNQSSTQQISTFNLRTLNASKALSDEQIFEEFENMKGYFVDNYGNSAVTDTELKKYLILAGYDLNDINLSHIEGNNESEKLNRWVEINIIQIQKKAQHRYNMYGTKHDIGLENAKLNVVNIDAKQDSYVSFTLDKNGKIQYLHFNVDSNSADSRYMTLERKSSKEFTRQGAMFVYGANLDVNGYNLELWLEFFEEPKDINKLRKILIAALYEEKENGSLSHVREDIDEVMALAIDKINKLTFDSFINQTDGAFCESSDPEAVTTVKYESYAKGLGKKGLQYSDFGTVHVNSMEGEDTVNETFVFAGGLEAKRISKNDLQGRMEFEGNAIAAVLHQDETNGKRIENTDSMDGIANLVFNNGSETLTANFDKWYNVTVTSNANKDNYNITFSNGNNIDKKYELYKFNDADSFTVDNFIGNSNDGSYGAVDIGYYGNNGKPEEVTGYVAYGQKLDVDNDIDLHAQIGFGMQKK